MGPDRYHPLITDWNGVTGWWIHDGRENTEHSLPTPWPHQTEPCVDYEECQALCAILNEEDAQDSADSG